MTRTTRMPALVLAVVAALAALGLDACLNFDEVYNEYCAVPGRCLPDGGSPPAADAGQDAGPREPVRLDDPP